MNSLNKFQHNPEFPSLRLDKYWYVDSDDLQLMSRAIWGDMARQCSKCQSKDTRRSNLRGFPETFLKFMGIRPYRCRGCGKSFFKFR